MAYARGLERTGVCHTPLHNAGSPGVVVPLGPLSLLLYSLGFVVTWRVLLALNERAE